MGDLLADRYRLDRRLGAGGMGEVWAGHDLALERAVAVKVLLDAATGEELIVRFRREATIGARLQHPGITVVHDVGRHEGRLFIVMELLTGEDLGAVLARERGGVAPEVAVDLAAQTAEALAAAHERGVVHRDLKPGNLFLLRSGREAPGEAPVAGRLKICDFGIAHSADATAGWTVTGRMFGTPPYMAPEQWRGEHVDARCDLYALGCVLYALLSGEPPFGSAEPMYVLMRRHVEDVPLTLREAGAVVSPELERLVLALLAKDPAERPESAAWVAKALRALPVGPTPGDGDGAGAGAEATGGAGVTERAGGAGDEEADGAASGRAGGDRTGAGRTGAGSPPTGTAGAGEAKARGSAGAATAAGSAEAGGAGTTGAGNLGTRTTEAGNTEAGNTGTRTTGIGNAEAGTSGAGSGGVGGAGDARDGATAAPAVLIPAPVRDFVREVLLEAEVALTSLPPGAGEVRTEGLALAAEAAARFDARLAGRLLSDAERWAWTDGAGDGERIAGLLTKLARRISPDAPARTERVLTGALQALFTVDGQRRDRRLRKVAEELAAVAPERGLALARRHFPGSAAQDGVLARAVPASAATDPARAREYLAAIRNPAVRAAAEAKAVTAVARRDPAAALALAERIPAGSGRVRALCRVVVERASVGDRSGAAGALALAERALAEWVAPHSANGHGPARPDAAGAGAAPGRDPEVEEAVRALEAARDLSGGEYPSVSDLDAARERVAAARALTSPAERGRELAWIARDCTAGAPWLAEAARDPGPQPPPAVTVTTSAESGRPARRVEPGGTRWEVAARPDAVSAAGERVVWTAGSEVGCADAATGAVLWRAHADEGVAAPPPPERLPDPGRVVCRADGDAVCVVVPAAEGSPERLVVREPADGRVRWWRELPAGAEVRPAGDVVLRLVDGELAALDGRDGATLWRRDLPERTRVEEVAGDLVLLRSGERLRALSPSDGEQLWSWPRGFRSGGRGRGHGPAERAAGPVHVLDGGVVRALDRSAGFEVWSFDPGPAASRPLPHDGVVYVTAYRSAAGGDVVHALDARDGTGRWERPVARRENPRRALEPLGVRGGVLYLRSREGSRRGLLGRMAREGRTGAPFLVGLDLGSGRASRLWEREEFAAGDVVLGHDTLVVGLATLTGIGLPLP
ncbi:protein kinase [Streptomyces sp. NPDC048606]|uniref:protein kinase domain-containing protein n=1 Tax=Streptomyces sp. NPDC048606 TaxID=3154726 RepID=UPI00343E1990